MAGDQFRAGVVGASSLLGKELAEELERSPLAAAEIVLLDDAEEAGRLTAAADEVTFVQRADAEAVRGLDLVFFCGAKAQTRELWTGAREAGAMVVDLSRALTEETGVMVWSPAMGGPGEPDLQTAALVPGYGPAVMLALVAERLVAAGMRVRELTATLLVPASEFGRAAMDELHQQTVSLLSFQAVPDEVFGSQSAFNVLSSFGDEAKVSLSEVHGEARQHYRLLRPKGAPEAALHALQAPVFHGYVISLLVELEDATELAAVEKALHGPKMRVLTAEGEEPSNAMAAGQEEVLVRVVTAHGGRRFWLSMAADNLRLAASEAVECALRLRRLRPRGKVQ